MLARVLADHEPFPAWVVRQPFTFLRANTAAEALFPGLAGRPPEQLIDLWFGPGPFRDSGTLTSQGAGSTGRGDRGSAGHGHFVP